MTELIASNAETFIRLVVAMLLGGLLGLERSLAHKVAGMRTYALVSMGSALFVIIGDLVLETRNLVPDLDPLRIASQIIVGVGFLGAGLIIFKESKLRGLTTAAGLWVSAGLGMAAGFGFYTIAVFVTLLTLFVFTILWFIEQKIEKTFQTQGNEEMT